MTISVRIVHLDHYMSTPGLLDRPYSPFSDQKLSKVPIIRIFGSTMAGQKVCLHVHQVFPYFYVPYTIPAHYTTEEEIQKDIFQFGTSLNEAMDLAKPNDRDRNRHIAAIVLTKGVPFYGYHVGYTSFLKIYLTNPYEKQQMLDILQTKAIQDTSFQPYEAHLNFELQFLLDHNLYGMDWLHIDDNHGVLEGSESFGISFRLPLLDESKASIHASQSSSDSSNIHYASSSFPIYTSRTVPTQLQSNELSRSSYCELELDITSMSILNRHEIRERNIHTSIKSEVAYLARQRNLNTTEQLVKSLEAIWKDELKRRIARGLKDPSIPPVTQIIDRGVTKDKWSTEASLRKILEKYMVSDAPADMNQETQEQSLLMNNILTNFQSVEALYTDAYFQFQAAQDDHASNAPITAVTPISNQMNVSATPSRYRNWDLPSQLNTSILHSFIEDISFHEEENAPDEEKNILEEERVEDDEDEFSLEDSLSNSGLAQWLQETEDKVKRNNHIDIEYERQTSRPRKIDFAAESQRIENILKGAPAVTKNESIFDSDDEEPFQISILPPESKPHMYKTHRQKSRNIDQVDGASDDRRREVKRSKTAEERWEEERKMLKRMRMNKKLDKKPSKEVENPLPSSVFPKKARIQIRKVDEKLDISESHDALSDSEDRLQVVSVVIPRYVPEEKKNKRLIKYSSEEEDEADSIWNIDSTLPSKKRRESHKITKSASLSPISSFSENGNETPFDSFDTEELNELELSMKEPEHIENKVETTEPITSDMEIEVISHVDTQPHEIIEISSYDSGDNPPVALDETTELNKGGQPVGSPRIPFDEPKAKTTSMIHERKVFDMEEYDRLSVVIQIPSAESEEKAFKNTEKTPDPPSSQEFEDPFPEYYDEPMLLENLIKDFPQPLTKQESTPETSTTKPTYLGLEESSVIQPFTSPPNDESFVSVYNNNEFIYKVPPPVISMQNKAVVYQEPFYSEPNDAPRYPTVFAGKEFKLPIKSLSTLPEFESTYRAEQRTQTQIKSWTLFPKPPSIQQVKEWMKSKDYLNIKKEQNTPKSQLINPTASNPFKFSATKPQVEGKKFRDHLDYFSLEIHANSRDSLLPDPAHDPVQLIFWCLQTEDQHIPSNGYQEGYYVGLIAMKEMNVSRIGLSKRRLHVDYAETEEDLFHILIEKIRYYDPDMLVGYETQSASWGYLVDRGVHLGFHLLDELSRFKMTTDTIKRDLWGYQKASVYKVVGRHMLNVWRLMRNELTLISYTMENVAYHLLHHRIPHYSHETLTSWYKEGSPALKYRLCKYYTKRVQLSLDMLDASQVIRRTCESARVYGIDFYAVITRGSQYDVESILFRIAKPENFCLISPSRLQVASQRSLECLPLVMEPVSQFYSSPMIVLDFQSLYPSIMIAYNYCYSTCLGRIRKPNESSQFGVLPSFELDSGVLAAFKDKINVSPNGVMFVKPEIRKSTLAKMLTELLDTRVMIKRSMKDYKDDSGLLRLLDAKQLTLKLLANVTYGYTSASFSGRMPSVEIADSIVSTGRETLERAIHLINTTEKWGARVVYGDTDSVFIYLPGKTRQEAFVLGQDIADTVTKMNPAPIKLKFEKVYHPTVLLAKKRYVGFKYESPSDTEPVFEAKGIETVRRDGTAATQKIMESSLKILFRTQDMSELKQYLYDEWTKILSNRVLLKEFIISKEVRMGTYSSRGGPNGAIVAQVNMDADARAEPQYGERVPYVVVYRGPNAKLKDKVVRPVALLNNSSSRLDAEYYIRKQIIPPLSRIFNLVGVDILSWYESMPRSIKVEAMNIAQENEQQIDNIRRIDQYYSSAHCIVCRKLTHKSICESCSEDVGNTVFTLTSRQQKAQQKFRKILQTCQECSKVDPLNAMFVTEGNQFADVPCDSLDCPIFYERLKAKKDVGATLGYDTLIQEVTHTT